MAWSDGLPDVIRGCWQLSEGHGRVWGRGEAFRILDRAAAGARGQRPELDRPFVLDMADIYTGVEELVGSWLAARSEGAMATRIHTKLVPDLDDLSRVDRAYVTAVVERSLRRLGVEAVDLVQLHWWDFAVPGWVEAATYLAELQDRGLVRSVGVTNFDAGRLAQLLDANVPVVSDQVQLSLLDRRPLTALAPLCERRGVSLLCYGTLAGGLLSAEWRRRPRPTDPPTRSVAKYLAVLDEVGGWPALQKLLDAVADVAADSGLSFAQIAAAWVRRQPSARAVIVGLSRRQQFPGDPLGCLDDTHRSLIEAALPPSVPGDVYEAERRRDGPHGRLMRYDLGRVS